MAGAFPLRSIPPARSFRPADAELICGGASRLNITGDDMLRPILPVAPLCGRCRSHGAYSADYQTLTQNSPLEIRGAVFVIYLCIKHFCATDGPQRPT